MHTIIVVGFRRIVGYMKVVTFERHEEFGAKSHTNQMRQIPPNRLGYHLGDPSQLGTQSWNPQSLLSPASRYKVSAVGHSEPS